MRFNFVMLYTRKGDDGTTKTSRAISVSPKVPQWRSLGALDEANFLGLPRARTKGKNFEIEKKMDFAELILETQQNLFIVQAEIAGATLSIEKGKVARVETIVDGIEKFFRPSKFFYQWGLTKMERCLILPEPDSPRRKAGDKR